MIKIEENTNMKIELALMVGILGLAAQANATIFDLTYTQVLETYTYGDPTPGTTTDAIGWVEVNPAGNAVTEGGLTVQSGPDQGTYILVPQTGANSLIQYDNVWMIDTTAGLVWSKNGTVNSGPEMNMWNTGNGEYGQLGGYYALWGGLDPNSSVFNVETYGTLAITPVPEASTLLAGTLMLLPFGVSTFRIMRRKAMA